MSGFTLLALSALPVALGFVYDDGTGRLPALGWNSWNAYGCNIDATKMLDAANYIVSKGFLKAGYNYVNLDDCWSIKSGRDNTTHQIVPDPTKFPDGISGLTDKLHSMGFKAGIYSSAGSGTCAGYPGSIGYEQVDAASFAAWGIDYLKYDNCGIPDYWYDDCQACNADATFLFTNPANIVNGTCVGGASGIAYTSPLCAQAWPIDGIDYSKKYTALRYRIMSEALQAQNRTIFYSVCEWGNDEPWTWGNATAQSWRTSNDISDNWPSIANILNINSFITPHASFGGHNDPDLLEVGNGNLTVQETRSHFALWALLKAPLFIGTDLSTISQANINILQNKHLLAFNQDPVYGASAAPYKWGTNPDWTFNATNPAEYWSGASSKGVMVAMLNTQSIRRTMTAVFDEIPELNANNPYRVINAWTGKNLGCQSGSVKMALEPHDTGVLLFKDTCVGVADVQRNSSVIMVDAAEEVSQAAM
ncbi:glycoside hydrolase family 27 protein [Zasmidium cellare ATCC 36951]|uniref:Alpha-galactosidase n=1 Tax=Zasmidium cellare ATCC 36951 TaxID=1080233 RepID=A0A6A6CXT2_ZASCE|nr:glycoside hydrolase family 27 protein [Zasmidium cellare ATCC 36951]KAF2171523.1 glycoside hydrolase family 27 protein [Zasmidium cellare ATCC 36951]